MSANELSPLKYVSVRVANDDTKETKVIFASCDTGAEICCLDAGLATDLAPNIVGQIQCDHFVVILSMLVWHVLLYRCVIMVRLMMIIEAFMYDVPLYQICMINSF